LSALNLHGVPISKGAGLQPFVSVIVLNYNGKHLLYDCFSTLFATDYENFEVILVDNASVDGSVEYVKKSFREPRFKVITLDRNYGPAHGRNKGIEKSLGDYVVLLDNDVRVHKKWLKEVVKVMESDPNIGAAQPKLLLDDEVHIDAAGGFIDYLGRVYQRGVFEEDVGQYDKIDEVFYAKNAAVIFRRKILKEVGLLDPDYFMYYEETDLCWRIWLRGYRVVYVPTSVVYHKGAATMGKKRSPEAIFSDRKNQIATLIKNYRLGNLVKYLPPILTRMFLFSVKLALKGKRDLAAAYLKAIIWNIVNLRKLWKKRMYVQHVIRRVSDEEVMRVMLKPSAIERIKRRFNALGLIEPTFQI
jgi:GT2 family glycosyltransferase